MSFSITTANGAGSYIIPDLAPGTYTVTEAKQPKGWKQTSTNCSAVVVMAGSIASCTITDTKNGKQKDDDNHGTVKEDNDQQKSESADKTEKENSPTSSKSEVSKEANHSNSK